MRKKVLTVTAIVSGIYVAALWVITSHAAGTEVVTQPLDNLKTLVIAVIGAVGLIILAKNIMEFAQAVYKSQGRDPTDGQYHCRVWPGRLFQLSGCFDAGRAKSADR